MKHQRDKHDWQSICIITLASLIGIVMWMLMIGSIAEAIKRIM